jgi:hypothetical protein
MDFKFFLNNLKNILLDPAKSWETIDSENKPVKVIRDSFLFPLLIMVTISAIAGSLIFKNTELSPVFSILTGLETFLTLFITVYASSVIFKEITYPLDLGRSFNVAFKIITYSLTPFLLTLFISSLFESMLFVNVLGLYGIYILWTGTEKLLSPPHHKKMPLAIASLITIAAIYSVTSIILTMLVERVFNAFFA